MKRAYSFPQSQRGVALIVTLVILLVVTFMGLVAMRGGMLQVAMSTNSQVNALLFQNADAGTNAVFNAISPDPTTNPTNPINQVRDNPGKELVGCLKSSTLTFGASVTSPVTCNPSQDFVSGRGAVAVQVSLMVPMNASGGAQTVINYGTDAGVLPGGNNLLVSAYATSVLPAFGSATPATITTCLGKPQEDSVNPTVTDCLAAQNASFETVVQEFSYGYPGY